MKYGLCQCCVLQFLHMLETATTFVALFFLSKAVSWGHGKVWRNIYQNTCSRCFHIVSKYPQAIPCLAHNKTLLGKHHTRTDRTIRTDRTNRTDRITRTDRKDRTDRTDRIRFLQNDNICCQGEHGPLGCLDVSLCLANHPPHCFPGLTHHHNTRH